MVDSAEAEDAAEAEAEVSRGAGKRRRTLDSDDVEEKE